MGGGDGEKDGIGKRGTGGEGGKEVEGVSGGHGDDNHELGKQEVVTELEE